LHLVVADALAIMAVAVPLRKTDACR